MATWDAAEADLRTALDESVAAGSAPSWRLNPGDGAFYGPKIDITIWDALRRKHQCATIQLDFELPQRFELEYMANVEGGGMHRPVIIQRAILGSVERMVAILTESCGGKWPFWLNPRQARVVPVVPQYNDYALEVERALTHAGFQADADTGTGDLLKKKIRNAEVQGYAFILTVGAREEERREVEVRAGGGVQQGAWALEAVKGKFQEWSRTRAKVVGFERKEEGGGGGGGS